MTSSSGSNSRVTKQHAAGDWIFQSFQPASHSHALCMQRALLVAEQQCRKKRIRLTHLRRRVLSLIWEDHRPITAYALLDQMKVEYPQTAPITIYRILEFLRTAGLIHRLESINAFIGCGRPEQQHNGQFLICQRCRTVAEIDDRTIDLGLSEAAAKLEFRLQTNMVELYGLCKDCDR